MWLTVELQFLKSLHILFHFGTLHVHNVCKKCVCTCKVMLDEGGAVVVGDAVMRMVVTVMMMTTTK